LTDISEETRNAGRQVDTDAPGHLPPAASGPSAADAVTPGDAVVSGGAATLKEAP
jgi:hypothetical protein